MPAAPQLTARRSTSSTSRARRSRRSASAGSACRDRRPTTSRSACSTPILGGSFTSRLNQNLREEHGYAYGASSTFDMRGSAGPFFAAAGVQTDKTAEALTEFFKELDGIRKPIPADELEKAKNYVALLLPRNFETTREPRRIARAAVHLQPARRLLRDLHQRVRAVTPADVQRAAERYIQPDKFAVVVVGDRKTIEPGIRALNLGPMTIVDDRRGHEVARCRSRLTFDELLRYTNAERDKWRAVAGRASRRHGRCRCSPAGRLADRRQADRSHLPGRTPASAAADGRSRSRTRTGLTGNNAPPLFDYGASVRRELEQYVADLDDDEADQVRTFAVREQQWPMTPRKLLFHILLHEIRHWAQIALAVRLAGLEPPGDHDLLFSKALR